jgi:hypothetical protein
VQDCMKRRLLYASSQAYEPETAEERRRVGWIEPPVVVRRAGAIGHRSIDQALVGRVPDGVVVAFRGSLPIAFDGSHDGWATLLDWLNDGLAVCVETQDYPGGVHLGFAESMRRLWGDAEGSPGVLSLVRGLLVRNLMDGQAQRHLFLTGHSKGGALANLAAWRASQMPEWDDMPLSVATIAAARAGNAAFACHYAATRIACLRYEVPSDPVPHLPPGPETPRWVRAVARQFGPTLAASNYHPVGLRVSATPVRTSWLGAWLGHIGRLISGRGVDLGALTPAVLAAHAIGPRSGYDRLICVGESTCGHGRAV